MPSVMMALAVGLAALGIWLDLNVFGSDTGRWWIYVSNPDEARAPVSTLLASMITMASLVFSITMVVLTLAASQFGPRLVRNFMASPETQVVLGTFAMTILYCLVVLSAIGLRGSEGEFAFSTVSIAIALLAVSVGLLVFFIHTLARSIVSESVIERVGRELDDILDELEPLGDGEPDENPQEVLPPGFEERAAHFGPQKAGYIQAIEFGRIVEAASKDWAVIGLYFRPGDYVTQNGRGIAVCPPEADTPELRARILNAVAVDVHRTPVQDIEYSIRHLAEIAVRALSPAINDPYTAVSVIHRLSASLAQLMERQLPPGVFRDEGGAVRVACPRPQYATMIGVSFDQIRQNGADKPLVVLHLIEALSRVGEHASLPHQLQALRHQLACLVEDAEREIANTSDRADATARAAKAMQALETGRCRDPLQ